MKIIIDNAAGFYNEFRGRILYKVFGLMEKDEITREKIKGVIELEIQTPPQLLVPGFPYIIVDYDPKDQNFTSGVIHIYENVIAHKVRTDFYSLPVSLPKEEPKPKITVDDFVAGFGNSYGAISTTASATTVSFNIDYDDAERRMYESLSRSGYMYERLVDPNTGYIAFRQRRRDIRDGNQ